MSNELRGKERHGSAWRIPRNGELSGSPFLFLDLSRVPVIPFRNPSFHIELPASPMAGRYEGLCPLGRQPQIFRIRSIF